MRRGLEANRRTDRRRGPIPAGTYRVCRRPHVARGRTSAAASIPCAQTPGPRVSACLRQAPPGVTKLRCARGDEALLRHTLSLPLSPPPTRVVARGAAGAAAGVLRRAPCGERAPLSVHSACVHPHSLRPSGRLMSRRPGAIRDARAARKRSMVGPLERAPHSRAHRPSLRSPAAARPRAVGLGVLAVPWSTAAVAGLASGRSLAGLLRSRTAREGCGSRACRPSLHGAAYRPRPSSRAPRSAGHRRRCARRMPPWTPADGHGRAFRRLSRLFSQQIALARRVLGRGPCRTIPRRTTPS
jgi:hypothetical protein